MARVPLLRTARLYLAEVASILHEPRVFLKVQELDAVGDHPGTRLGMILPDHCALGRNRPCGGLQPDAENGPGCEFFGQLEEEAVAAHVARVAQDFPGLLCIPTDEAVDRDRR